MGRGTDYQITLFVVNLHTQLFPELPRFPTFPFYSRLFTLTFVVLLISLPYPIPVRFYCLVILAFNVVQSAILSVVAPAPTRLLQRVHAFLFLLSIMWH